MVGAFMRFKCQFYFRGAITRPRWGHHARQFNPSLFDETVNSENKVEIGFDSITFNKNPKQQFYFGNLTGGEELKAEWILTNLKANIGIKEIGSFKTDKVNLWGWGHVISPELFFKISVDPKKIIEWSRKFEVFKINP